MQVFGAYERSSGRELCLGIFESMEELCDAMRISYGCGWSNYYRTRNGEEEDSTVDFTIVRFVIPGRKNK